MVLSVAFALNDKIKTLTPYDPICGAYPIRLDANESYIPFPDEVQAEMRKALEETALNRYPDPYAQKVCCLFASFYGISPELVTAGDGSDELISIIMSAFLQKGDKVLTLAPDFSMYRFYTGIVECPCVTMEKNADFTIDPQRVIDMARREGARLIVFSNPCNPTSVGLSADDARKIIRGTDALVVLDEAYMDFWDQSLLREAAQYDNLIILRTCSKAIGLAGIRLGFAVANEMLTRVIRSVKSPYNVNSVSQALGCVAFSHPEQLRRNIERLIVSREALYRLFQSLAADFPGKVEIVRPVTNFVWAKCERAGELFDALKRQGIIVRRMGEYLRVTAGRNHENEKAADAIRFFYTEKG
ncbi:MAG: pyridoxal phosphate-dependent aminotransferase [Acutalibacteraceae bacterium]